MKESDNAFWCLCPFHADTNPSMIVNKTGPFAGTYRCWACGAHGKSEELDFVRSAHFKKEFPINAGYAATNLRLDRGLAGELANQWGVAAQDVMDFGHHTDRTCHLFPMYDARMNLIGGQRRLFSGRKLCVHGSELGLFLPRTCRNGVKIVVTEGLSDAVVAYHLGFHARGRPSVLSCVEMIGHYCVNYAIRAALFVADNDPSKAEYTQGIGVEGARRAVQAVRDIAGIPSCFVQPPKEFKDLREFYQRASFAAANDLLIGVLKRLE